MAKPNYGFEKRQREIAKKKQQDEKRLKKQRAKEDGTAENAIDGQTANFWHTEWSDKKPGHPHRLILDLGQSREIGGFRYTPRQSQGGGRIKDYKVYVGDELVTK